MGAAALVFTGAACVPSGRCGMDDGWAVDRPIEHPVGLSPRRLLSLYYPPVSRGEAVSSQSRRVSVMSLQPSGAVPLLSDLHLALVLSWSSTPLTGISRRRVRVVTPTPLMHKTHHHFLRAAGDVAGARVRNDSWSSATIIALLPHPPSRWPRGFRGEVAATRLCEPRPVHLMRPRGHPAYCFYAMRLSGVQVLPVHGCGGGMRFRRCGSGWRLRRAWLSRLSFTSGLRPQRPGKRCLGARGRLAVARRAAKRPGLRPTTAAPFFFYIRMSSPPFCAAIPSGVPRVTECRTSCVPFS